MPEQQFGNFTASELYCPKCKTAQPVREHLLLVLPSGELYEFRCSNCGTSLGKRTVTGPALPPSPKRQAGRHPPSGAHRKLLQA
jgi:hypothetical protein